jgi:hypothetical protein
VGDGLAIEEPFAGAEFVEDAAEGPDVGTAVDGFAGGLFGGHVAGGAENETGFGGAEGESGGVGGVARGSFGGFGEAEIEHFDDAFGGDFDVAGFEFAVE